MTPSSYFKLVWLDNNKGVCMGIAAFWILCLIMTLKLLRTLKQPAWIVGVGFLILLVYYYLLLFFSNRYFSKKSLSSKQLKTINQMGYVCWFVFGVLAACISILL